MNHSMKMMWGCVALAVVAVILVASGLGGGYFLLLIPCMIMMGMMRGTVSRRAYGGPRGP
jgi:hypothetical protein